MQIENRRREGVQSHDIPAEVARRLDEIRQDPQRLMRYDRNGDGRIDADEWAEVARMVEAEVRTEIARAHEDPLTHAQLAAQVRADGAGEDAAQAPREVLQERFELVREVGRGSQGRALMGRDRQSDRLVLVKELAMDQVAEWKAVDLFEREAEVLRGLSHPAIPAFIDSFSVQDAGGGMRFFLVQEYVDGDDLADLMAAGLTIGESEARAFLREMLGILDYLHRRDEPIIHRDIKPANIIRRGDRRLALVDFGAVQSSEVGASHTTIIGTSGYMPLEQLMGRAQPATDIYALGATLVHLLSRKHPADLPVLEMALQFQAFINVSARFETLLEKMLSVHVEDRLQSAREVLELLDADLSQAPPSSSAVASEHQGEERARAATKIQFHRPGEDASFFESSTQDAVQFDFDQHSLNFSPSIRVKEMGVVEQPKYMPAPDTMRATWEPEEDGFQLTIPAQWDRSHWFWVFLVGAGWLGITWAIYNAISTGDYEGIVMLVIYWVLLLGILAQRFLVWGSRTILILKGNHFEIVKKTPIKTTRECDRSIHGVKAVCKQKVTGTDEDSMRAQYYIDFDELLIDATIATAKDDTELLYLCQEMNKYFAKMPKGLSDYR